MSQIKVAHGHGNELGKAPSHRLLEAVTVKRKNGVESPRSFTDYEVMIDRAAISAGVEVIERIGGQKR